MWIRKPTRTKGRYSKKPTKAWLTGTREKNTTTLTQKELRDLCTYKWLYPVTTSLHNTKTQFRLPEVDAHADWVVKARRGDGLKRSIQLASPHQFRFTCKPKSKLHDSYTHLTTGGEKEDMVQQKFFQVITRHDMWTCAPGKMINDEIVWFFLQMLQSQHEDCVVLNTFFMVRLTCNFLGPDIAAKWEVEFDYDNVRRWTRYVDVFNKKWLMVPINMQKPSKHWILLAMNMFDKTITLFDSCAVDGRAVYIDAIQY